MLIQNWLHAILILCFVSFSILGYARILLQKLKYLETWSAIVLSLGMVCSALVITGCFILKPWIQIPLLAPGLFYFRFSLIRFNFLQLKRTDWYFLFFPILFFITRFFSAGLPQQHNDALYYHLYAPKEWVEAGRIILNADHPSFSQATLFEMLYLIPQFFVGINGYSAHVTTQIYSQWMHFIWGQLGFVLLVNILFHKLYNYERSKYFFVLFISFLVATLPCVEWTGGLAKNDYVTALFAIAAIITMVESKHHAIIFAGIFTGLAFATKMSALCTLISLPILFLNKKFFENSLKYTFGVFIGFAPLFFRNIVLTGNPIFPMFDQVIGPHWIADWWIRHNASYSGFFKLDSEMIPWIWNKLLEKSLSKILLLLSLFGFFLRKSKHNKFYVFSMVQLLLIILMLRPGTDGRYAGYSLTILFVFLFSNLLQEFQKNRQFDKLKFSVILLGLLINSPIDLLVKIPFKYWFSVPERYVLEYHAYQEMKDWMNRNIDRPEIILAIADKANFYLDRKTITFTENREWEELTNRSYDHLDFLRKIHEKGIRYVFLQTHFVYPDSLSRLWEGLMKESPRITRFKVQSTLLLDLSLL